MIDSENTHDGTDIVQYTIVCETPTWLLGSENVAVATAVTPDGQVVEGIGASRWSTDRAIDAAIDHARSMAATVAFSYRITKVRVGRSNATFQRVGDAAFRKGGGGLGGNHALVASSRVWIRAGAEDSAVQASGKAYVARSPVRRALKKAIDDASTDLQRIEGVG
jgi:flavin-binding protein dodecin